MTADRPFFLHVYDISGGLAQLFSGSILGTQIDGIWHSGVVVDGIEYFYGDGIQSMPSAEFQRQHQVVPTEVIELGSTNVPTEGIEEFLNSAEIKERFNRAGYHLINNNCNHFSDTLTRFLRNGEGIPDRILNVAENVLNTPGGVAAQQLMQGFREAFAQPNRRTEASNTQQRNHNQNESQNPDSNRTTGTAQSGSRDQGVDPLEELAQGVPQFLDQVIRGLMPEGGQSSQREVNRGHGCSGNRGGRGRGRGNNSQHRRHHGQRRNRSPGSGMNVNGPPGIDEVLGAVPQVVEGVMQNFMDAHSGARGRRENRQNGGVEEILGDVMQAFAGAVGQGAARRSRQAGARGTRHAATSPTRAPEQNTTSSEGATRKDSEDVDIPLREDIQDFVSNAFPEPDEAAVVEKLLRIFRREGYYSMSMLKSISEEELLSIGIKKGWAKRITECLELYYSK
mmetsp:Transcript_14927/g.19602  ORF Transcript_14927/g.19602 Transcript_14927/m.19602 type:complete len:452 (+) Transcript_14927:152-1507(+)